MDVHPPHGSLHSWKDFWIHLGTISIGLLIAISLEQSVEWVHHVHQRHQLEEDLREEGLRNLDLVAGDMQGFDAYKTWLLDLRHNVDTMRQSGGKIKLPYVVQPKIAAAASPSDAVWVTARESSLIELLPRQLAVVYARLYWQHDLAMKDGEIRREAGLDLTSFDDRFDDTRGKSHPDLSLMTLDELNQYSILLTRYLATTDNYASRLRSFANADRAVLDGATSEQDMLRRMRAAADR